MNQVFELGEIERPKCYFSSKAATFALRRKAKLGLGKFGLGKKRKSQADFPFLFRSHFFISILSLNCKSTSNDELCDEFRRTVLAFARNKNHRQARQRMALAGEEILWKIKLAFAGGLG